MNIYYQAEKNKLLSVSIQMLKQLIDTIPMSQYNHYFRTESIISIQLNPCYIELVMHHFMVIAFTASFVATPSAKNHTPKGHSLGVSKDIKHHFQSINHRFLIYAEAEKTHLFPFSLAFSIFCVNEQRRNRLTEISI